jgi:TRAP-type C4-dicarboxylate transport system substrate-binding protein
MKNKVVLMMMLTGSVFLLMTALLPLAVSEAASEKPIQMTYSDMFPSAHLHGVLSQRFCDEIRNRTKGRVEITFYPPGTLLSPVKCYEGVVKGIADIGMSSPSYVQGRFPVSEAMLKPLETYSGWVTSKVCNDLYAKYKPAEYKDVHVLYFHGPGPNVIATRSDPVRKLEDLKGLVLRAVGPTVDTLTAWGATPRAMPMGESFEAISKGIVNGTFTGAEALKGFKLGDVVKYVTIPPISNVGIIFVVINKERWKSLPADIKKVFTEVSQEFVEKRSMLWNYIDKEGIDYFKGLSKDREIITIPKDQHNKWLESVKPVLAKYIKEKTAMGLPTVEYVDYIVERSRYWAKKQPTGEVCSKWVQENLLKK